MKPLAITLGDPAGIGAEVVFKALATMDVPVRVFGSRVYANPPSGVPFVDVDANIPETLKRLAPLPFGSRVLLPRGAGG